MTKTTTAKKNTRGKAKGAAAKKTTTKKKAAPKKGTKKAASKKEDDAASALDDDLEKDLQNEFDFDTADEGGEEKDDSTGDADESLEGKWVKFKEGGKTVYGQVAEHNGDQVVIETAEEMLEGKTAEVEIVDRDDVPEAFLFDDEDSDSEGDGPEDADESDAGEDSDDAENDDEDEEPEDEPEAESEDDEEDDVSNENETDSEVPERRYLEIAKIKVPKSKPRDVDVESAKYKAIKADINRRGQREAIKIRSFTNPELVEGLRRLTAMTELGLEYILCEEDEQVEDAQDRLFNGLLDNEMREAMAPLDLARTFASLVKGGKYTQKKIARGLGISETEVSKTIALVKLPKKTREVIADLGQDSDYSKGVLLELTTAPASVQKQITGHMEAGEKVTVADVRTMKKEAKKAEKAAAGDKSKDKSKPEDKGSKGLTYKRLSKSTVSERAQFTVRGDEVEVTFKLPWKRKTFKGMDLIKEIKGVLDEGFADEETTCESLNALIAELTAAKSELSK